MRALVGLAPAQARCLAEGRTTPGQSNLDVRCQAEKSRAGLPLNDPGCVKTR